MAWNGQWPQQMASGMAIPGMDQYTPEQQQVMVQQNMQQWQSYYQQYAQWQAQYGQQYQQELNKLQPPLPDHQPPPPPPPAPSSGDGKPPPPPLPENSNTRGPPVPVQPPQQQQANRQPPHQQNNNRNNNSQQDRRNPQFNNNNPQQQENFGGFDGPDQFQNPQQHGQGQGRVGGNSGGFQNFDQPNDRRRNQNNQRNKNNMGDHANNNNFNNNNRFQNQRPFGGNDQGPENNNLAGRGGCGGRGGRGNRGGGGAGGGRFNNNRDQNAWEPNPNNNNNNRWDDGGPGIRGGRGGGRGRGRGGRGGGMNNRNNMQGGFNNQQNFHQQENFNDFNENPDFHADHQFPDQQFHGNQADEYYGHNEDAQYDQQDNQNMNYGAGGLNNQMNSQNQNRNNNQQPNQFGRGNQGCPQQQQNNPQQQQQEQHGVPTRDQQRQEHGVPTRAQQQQWDKEDDDDERVFDEQFRKWEDQFNNWKVQNQDHPDRNSYTRYEREFEDVRIRLMERRDQMRQRRLNARQEILMGQGGDEASTQQQQNTQQQWSQNRPQGGPSQQQLTAPPPPPPPEIDEGLTSARDKRGEGDREFTAPEEESYDENVESFFTRSGGRGGIPGLDLVEPLKEKDYIDGAEVINLEEEEAAAQRMAEEERLQEEEEERAKEENDSLESQKPTFEVDAENINNILQNPNIMSLLSKVQGKTEESSAPPPANDPPNVTELLQNPNIQGVLQQVQITLNPKPQPNINDLLQNPNISNLLSGLQRQQSQPQQQQMPPVWNNQQQQHQVANFHDHDQRNFVGNLPPAFRGNPEALGFGMGNNFSGPPPPYGQNYGGGGGMPPYGGPHNSGFGPGGGPSGMQQQHLQNQQHQQNVQQHMNISRDFNLLPPPVIHGSRRPDPIPEFGKRRPPQPVHDILVPTKVVDYQHRSAMGKDEPLDYFHRKSQSDPKPQPQGFKNRNLFTSRWSAPKRQSRFSDEPEVPEQKRARQQETGRDWTKGTSNQNTDAGKRKNNDRGNSSSSSTTQGVKGKVEDYLEGISDEEIETKDDDSLSLSSVEEVVNSPAPRGSQKKDEPWFSCHDSGDPNLISIEKLLLNPGRKRRPRRIVIVIRGLPGSGKTHIAKLIKDKEVEMGGSAPRILSIDDYFTSETDEIITCPQTGKDINLKSMVYEYEKEMEEKYLQYLLKSYKKTVADGYFDFIIVDAVYPKMSSVLEFTSHAKDKGFVSYICSLELEVEKCFEQNIHSRTEEELKELAGIWEPCPAAQLRLDVKPLIEWSQVTEIPVEDISDDDMDMEDDKEKSAKKCESNIKEEEMDVDRKEEKKVGKEDVSENKESVAKEDVEVKVQSAEVSGPESVNSAAVSDVVKTDDNCGDGSSASVGKTEVSVSEQVQQNPEATDKKEEVGGVKEAEGVKEGENTLDKKEDPEEEKGLDAEGAEKNEAEEEVALEEPVGLEAQLQEELDTNFEDLEGDAPVEDELDEEDEEDLEPEPMDDSLFKSKWDSDPKEDRLAKMDGISKPLRAPTIEEYLQTDEYLQTFEEVEPGKKRVRWADIEEKKAQDKMRAIGFVVGQTDWNRMMDPTEGQGALTKTKYIDRVRKDDPS